VAKRRWKRNLAQAHLDQLAARYDIDIIWLTGRADRDWKEAQAFFMSQTVHIPRPWTMRLYLIALHEFGHLLSKQAVKLWESDPHDLEKHAACEGAAWGWAVANVDPDLRGYLTNESVEDIGYAIGLGTTAAARAAWDR